MTKKERIVALVLQLNKASKAYYTEDTEIMSNFDYDKLYDELVALENELGIILPNSPTQIAGYKVVSELEKVKHEYPALSLDKRKEPDEIVKWAKGQETVLLWKMDGLSILNIYQDGNLVQSATRGSSDDNEGEVITHNARFFKGLPQTIDYKGHLVVRGEATISYSEWIKINNELPEGADLYKNARNLASSTVRDLDSSKSSKREVVFSAFRIENMDNLEVDERYDVDGTFSSQMSFISELGINTVDWEVIPNSEMIPKKIEEWTEKVESANKCLLPDTADIPVDGLVFTFEDTVYGASLGSTGHHARSGMAFKWQDELFETTIQKIFWSASRSGLLNPVAVFDTVEIDNTSVSRASVHNVSILRNLGIIPGSKVTLFKANQIIPQLHENLGTKEEVNIPEYCPICGSKTRIVTGKDGSETLWCENPECAAKHIGNFSRFVSRDGLNMRGIAEKQIQQLIEEGFLKTLDNFYDLTDEDFESISKLEGWGVKSALNFKAAIKKSVVVDMNKFLYSLGIPNFGHDATKIISKAMTMDEFKLLIENNGFMELDFTKYDGIGQVTNESIQTWFSNHENRMMFFTLCVQLDIKDIKVDNSSSQSLPLQGKVFVITGSLEHYTNRDSLKDEIESLGGKVSGSVSAKTNYLINNEKKSTSGKNQKAMSLNIPIISEETYMQMK